MVAPVISARSLTKRYGDLVAVDGIDFDIEAGESFGFLGPNGAGKSTTMRMIAATSTRTSGTLTVLGMDTNSHGPEIRAQLGIVPQGDLLDEELRVIDNLVVYGRYFALPRAYVKERAEQLLDFAQLREKRTARVDGLSGGMKRRLTIARGLINNPKVMLLDEPTTGLDPQARHILWDRLFRLKEQGTTLVVTTHFMDEAEQLCDRLVVVDNGRIVAEGSPSSLIRAYSTREVLEVRFGAGRNEAVASSLQGVGERLEALADRVLIYAADGEQALQRVLDLGLDPVASLVRRSSLEDVFLRLTGRSLIE
ncbi:lipooligosaccharide transport system ATP-binding protein [Tessaracoccus bendigoensis DSM 12906]|uniref:Lipooligosaccharide transport system ATP-binding protein n=1 Tax=Tessaracoccus bendigoensis DSM 12906 TaxID=1123357 RepID=A0A1M6HLS4_9ACTN|nr:ABC transporter ATP-binding protein [Tessaracoccus bendigoensis]SHJ23095.1 lipooligosaccharide transport system ATP-binding protein [Tessaracoccus bendigoensis DSM 12906]